MRSLTVCFALALALSTVAPEASAQPPASPPQKATAQVLSPRAGRTWSLSFSKAAATKLVKETASGSETKEQLFLWDSQVAVSCTDRRPGSEHRAGALGCFLHVESATISPGKSWGGTPTIYDLGEGAGTISYVDRTGTSSSAVGECFDVKAGAGPVTMGLPSQHFLGLRAASARAKGCRTSGRPCRSDSDCTETGGSGAKCDARYPISGAYLGLVPTSTTVSCRVREIQ